MAHPLSARLVLLAAAFALAAALVLAVVMAEHRDRDGRATQNVAPASAEGPGVEALRRERARAMLVRAAD